MTPILNKFEIVKSKKVTAQGSGPSTLDRSSNYLFIKKINTKTLKMVKWEFSCLGVKTGGPIS